MKWLKNTYVFMKWLKNRDRIARNASKIPCSMITCFEKNFASIRVIILEYDFLSQQFTGIVNKKQRLCAINIERKKLNSCP
jgi:hypothetical protein